MNTSMAEPVSRKNDPSPITGNIFPLQRGSHSGVDLPRHTTIAQQSPETKDEKPINSVSRYGFDGFSSPDYGSSLLQYHIE
jgi:hypothetical protein